MKKLLFVLALTFATTAQSNQFNASNFYTSMLGNWKKVMDMSCEEVEKDFMKSYEGQDYKRAVYAHLTDMELALNAKVDPYINRYSRSNRFSELKYALNGKYVFSFIIDRYKQCYFVNRGTLFINEQMPFAVE